MTSVLVMRSHKSEAISYLSRASLFIRLNLAIKTFGRFDAEAAFCLFAINGEGCSWVNVAAVKGAT